MVGGRWKEEMSALKETFYFPGKRLLPIDLSIGLVQPGDRGEEDATSYVHALTGDHLHQGWTLVRVQFSNHDSSKGFRLLLY